MSAAMVWDRTSPKLYEDLFNSNLLVLPHRSTLRRLTSALSVKEGLEIGTIKYLSMRYNKLNPKERLVNLAMDEVYTARAVELAGGRVYGDSEDGVTNTLFCTHISSVAGRFEDLVSMSPVPHITTNDIKHIFFKVLKSLTEIGFIIVSVTTDGHRTNQSFHNALGHDGLHPEYIMNPYSSDVNARVYTMYDTVHLFKNIYFNLLNKKTLLCPSFSYSGTPLRVQFNHLLQLYNMEYGREAKMAYRLTDKVLHPSSVERANVQLAVAATHETTIAALDYYGQKEEYSAFKETAEFLRLVRKWFDIVNVKCSFVHIRMNDTTRKPVTKEWKEGQHYLEKFGSMMSRWLVRDGKGNKISTDTLKATIYTCRGLIGLSNYLLNKHGDLIDYVLLGKIQSDKIEGHFGHLRKLAGGNYWASVRQFMEGEAVVRAKSLVWLSGYSLGEVATEMDKARQQRKMDDTNVINNLVEAASQAEREDIDDATEQAISHLAGYLARSVLKVHRCEPCQDLLVNREASQESAVISLDVDEAQEDVRKSLKTFTDLLNRGNLMCPSITAVDVSKEICHTYRCLMKDKVTRYALFGCTNPKEAFQNVMSKISENNDQLRDLSCVNGHKFVDKTFRTMAGALFNAFTSNYSKDITSDVHNKKKSPGISVTTRNQSNDKIRKLTGRK
jgi:hypothetical protein